MLVSENFMIKVFIQISIPMHILVVGNIESGIVADCTSKELLVINLIKQEHFKHIWKQICQIFVTEILFVKYLLQKNSLLNICPRNTFCQIFVAENFFVKYLSQKHFCQLQEANSCEEKDDLFTCVCNTDG